MVINLPLPMWWKISFQKICKQSLFYLTLQKNIMNKVKSRVHRLPTKNQTHILVNTYINPDKHTQSPVLDFESSQRLHRENTDEQLEERGFKHQYLYATTYEKVNVGDWFYVLGYTENCIQQCFKADDRVIEGRFSEDHYGNSVFREQAVKIVASNDPSLGTSEDYKVVRDSGHMSKTFSELPQLPLSFIRDYCNQGGIDEILVEYDAQLKSYVIPPYEICTIKTDSNNEITIHPIEEKTYTRSQVIAFGHKCAEYGYENELDNEGQLTAEFIDDNL